MSDQPNEMQHPVLEQESPDAGGRVIRPGHGEGVLLDNRHFHLRDITELMEALEAKSRGRLKRLQQAADQVEARLRDHVERSRKGVAEALDETQRTINEQLEGAAQRSRDILKEAWRRGKELGRQEGFKSGYDEGLQKGMREGRELGEELARSETIERLRADTDNAREAILALAEEFEHGWRRIFAEARRGLMRLATEIAGRVIRREVREVPEIVLGNLAVAIDRIADRSRVTIELHPSDREVVARYLEDLDERLAGCETVSIAELEEITPGGCRLRTGLSTIDLTVETQLEVIERRLIEAGGGGA
ncbi:MAG: FliH/SctL family protein [Planctomycetota bacterium]